MTKEGLGGGKEQRVQVSVNERAHQSHQLVLTPLEGGGVSGSLEASPSQVSPIVSHSLPQQHLPPLLNPPQQHQSETESEKNLEQRERESCEILFEKCSLPKLTLKRKRKALVWEHFGQHPTDTTKIVCIHCYQKHIEEGSGGEVPSLSFRCSSDSLQRHLRNKHHIETRSVTKRRTLSLVGDITDLSEGQMNDSETDDDLPLHNGKKNVSDKGKKKKESPIQQNPGNEERIDTFLRRMRPILLDFLAGTTPFPPSSSSSSSSSPSHPSIEGALTPEPSQREFIRSNPSALKVIKTVEDFLKAEGGVMSLAILGSKLDWNTSLRGSFGNLKRFLLYFNDKVVIDTQRTLCFVRLPHLPDVFSSSTSPLSSPSSSSASPALSLSPSPSPSSSSSLTYVAEEGDSLFLPIRKIVKEGRSENSRSSCESFNIPNQFREGKRESIQAIQFSKNSSVNVSLENETDFRLTDEGLVRKKGEVVEHLQNEKAKQDSLETMNFLLMFPGPIYRFGVNYGGKKGREGHSLVEVAFDLGRPPVFRFHPALSQDDISVSMDEYVVSSKDLEYIVSPPPPSSSLVSYGVEDVQRQKSWSDDEIQQHRTYLTEFIDHRAGMEGLLHRISRGMNRKEQLVSLTCRLGRAVLGSSDIISDVMASSSSLLIVGPPGSGKTTLLRDLARVLADEHQQRVCIVDTSNEVAGDSDIPHPGIGKSRRFQVPHRKDQFEVMLDVVCNHSPQVVVVDEITTRQEANSAQTIRQRGVRVAATTHGTFLSIVRNPILCEIIGGLQSVILGDRMAKIRSPQQHKKSFIERISEPTFETCIQVLSHDSVILFRDVGLCVDDLLAHRPCRGVVRQHHPSVPGVFLEQEQLFS